MTPEVSVFLPAHNRADVIGAAIASILAQSHADFELLVAGDGCKDDTAAVVTGFSDSRIKWFDLPKGPGRGYQNRNYVLRQARGEFVVWAQHDDLMLPDHLELMVNKLREPLCFWAYSMPLWVSDDGLCIPFLNDLTCAEDFKSFMNLTNFAPSCCIALRRECLEEVGYFDPRIAHAGDWDLWKRIVSYYGQRSIGVVSLPTALHFRAAWRDKHSWAPPLWRKIFEVIAQNQALWPKALTLDSLKTSKSPQNQAWEEIRSDPNGFCLSLRSGVQQAQKILRESDAR